ncbi:hypothetical protein DSO57_1011420 [Entomophthora muscae]|uniref:Uncharacterized protein n=1 Tax=Entomophthora muscae TaxID=34485 RepID=A0ACC2USK1_9FUNG|nr:hypothetical protein DSO57_1011420 [Entomophthora muscae]
MGNFQVKLSGPIMAGLSHNVISGLDWLQHNCPYIDWDTSVITLNRNGVGFQIYPIKMSKLLHDNVFVRITEMGKYDLVRNLLEEIPVNNALEKPTTKGDPKPGLFRNIGKSKLVSNELNNCFNSGMGIKPETSLGLIVHLDDKVSFNLLID